MTVQINGTSGITTPGITTDTSVANTSSTLTGESLNRIKVYTVQTVTSGTAIDFTNIPSWAKKITIVFDGVSFTGSDLFALTLGTSSGLTTSGYTGSYQLNTIASPSVGTGGTHVTNFALSANNSSGDYRYGVATIILSRPNTWVLFGTSSALNGGVANNSVFSGVVSLSGVLTQLRLGGTSSGTFDSGSVNIIVEG